MKRVLVIGNSCAGKTTFSRRLSRKINAQHIELDALFWEPNWVEAQATVFRERVSKEISRPSWIVDGNYKSKIHDLVWPYADTIIWLDPSLATVLRRFFIRSFTRSFRKELLWGGCQESLKNSIFQRNSLLAWILKTHKRKSKDYLNLVDNPPKGVSVYRLSTVAQVEEFFRNL